MQDSSYLFLPSYTLAESAEIFDLVYKIVSLMRQRQSADELEDSVVENTLHIVLDAVINDSCTFVSMQLYSF